MAQRRRRGQDHPKAILTDAEVELIISLYEKDGWKKPYPPKRGTFSGWTMQKLADKFEVKKACIRDILSGRCRGRRANSCA